MLSEGSFYNSPMAPDTPFNDFANIYLLHQKNRNIKSYPQMKAVLTHFIRALSDTPLNKIRRLDIQNYILNRQGLGIKPGTINYELSVLAASINYVSHLYEIEIPNPAQKQRLSFNNQRLRYLEPVEASSLLDAARPDLLLHHFITLALNTGCRKNELFQLEWVNVDLVRNFIVIQPETAKTKKRRILPLNQHAQKVLRELHERKPTPETRWVFYKADGSKTKPLDYRFRKAVKAAGIVDFRIHDLRHTFASWLVSEGVDLIKVRDLLGHASITMTERYAHLIPNRLEAAVSILDRLI